MKIDVGDIVETLITLKRGTVTKITQKYVVIEFTDGSEGDYILNNIDKHIRIIAVGSTDGITKVDFKQLRQAKVLVKELEGLISLLDTQIKDLTPHKKYITITESILALKESKMFLEIHLKRNKLILSNAGVKG
jgi:hypothetical protein